MGIWIRRILLGLLGLLGLLVLAIVGLFLYDVLFGPKTTDAANTRYTDAAGNELLGYLAEPEGPGPHPAVLMIHEWWGLTEDITVLADAMAAEGYVVFAPDAYRGRVTNQVPRALFLRLGTPEEQIAADLDAALDYLTRLPGVDAERIAALGYCFGGEQAMKVSLRAGSDRVPVTVVHYGSTPTDAAAFAPLAGSDGVLGIFGETDAQIPPEEAYAFEAALAAAGIPHEVTVYPGVGHAFITEENYDDPGPAGEAWQQALDFLDDTLNP